MLRLLKKNKITKWGFAGVELLILMTLIVGVAAATRLVQQAQNPQTQSATTGGKWIGKNSGLICLSADHGAGTVLHKVYTDNSCGSSNSVGYGFRKGDKCPDKYSSGDHCYRAFSLSSEITINSFKPYLPQIGDCTPNTNKGQWGQLYEECTWKESSSPADKCTGNCVTDANLCGEGYKYNSKGNADCASRDSAHTYCCEKTSSPPPTTNTTCSSIGYCSYENDLCNPGYIGVGKKDCDQFFYCCANLTPTPDPLQGKWIDDLGSACTSTNSSPYYTQFYPLMNYCYGDYVVKIGSIPCATENKGKCFKARGPKNTITKKSFKSTSLGNECKPIPSQDQIPITDFTILDECEWSGTGGTGGGRGPGGGPPGGGPGPGDGGGTGGQCSKESSSKCGGQNIGDSCGSGGSCSNPRNEQGSDGKPLCKCKEDKPGADIGGNTKGYHDGDYGQSGRCAVFGWTCDPDKIDQPVTVRIRQGPNVLAEVAADQPAEDAVKNICAGTANHRFEYIAPADSPLRDGQPHTITVEAKNVDDLGNFVNEYVELGNTPYQMTCAAGAPPTCKRCSYNYDFCQAQWPDVGGCGIPAPGTTVDYSLDFSCPVATPQPGATDTTCPDKDNLQSCSRCSNKYKYLYADFASKDGCLTSVDDTQIHKKYKVDCSCTDGQDAADFTLYPYINKTEYDACFLESTITPTPTVDPNYTPPPSPTPTGMWWYTPEGEKCDSTNYRAFLTVLCPPEFQDVLTNSVGFTTEGIPDQTPCDLTSGEKCWGVGGSEVTDLNTEVIKSYKDFKTSCVSQPPDQLPAKMYSRIWECGWREDPDSQVEGEVIINFADSNDFDFIYVYLLETLNPRNLRFFEIKKADASGNVDTITGQAKTYQMANLFSGTTYKIYAKVYKKDTDSGSIREINATNQIENPSPQTATCDDASCEFMAVKNSSAKFNFTLTLPQSQPVGQGGGGDQSSNDTFQQMMVMYSNEKLTALDVSRFILQLTRNPGLQKGTCNPVIPGGCEFGK